MQEKYGYRKLSILKKLKGNPRIIKDEDFKILCDSIKNNADYFEARPIILSDRTGELVIIAGNMRYEAAKHLGIKEVPTFVMEGLTEQREKEIIIRDNVSNGQWDFDELANGDWDLDLLKDWGLDIPGLDMDTNADVPEEAEEDNYEIPDEIKTDIKVGDVFEIKSKGLKHRVMCGDSTKAEHVDKLMNGRLADCMITDPPYNVNYQGGTKEKLKIENDQMTDVQFKAFLHDAFKMAANAMKAGAGYYVYHASREAVNFIESLRANGLTDRQQLIWVKSSLVLGRQDYQWRHEPILYGWKEGAAHYFINVRSITTVIEDEIDLEKLSKAQMKDMLQEMLADTTPSTIIREDKPLRNGEHPTMKPLKLIGRNVINSTRMYDLIVDLFGGSGSTIAASHQLMRNCYTMELDPKYVQVILDRMRKADPECEITEAN